MKILYGVQGTGNGHIARAKELLPILKTNFEVDIIQSGNLFDLDLGYEILYKKNGISFKYNDKGGLSYLGTAKKIKFSQLSGDIKNLDLKKYDLILNDFEPISAWSAKSQNIPCMAFSHQCSFLSKEVPKPLIKNIAGEIIFKYFAPNSGKKIGFHFKRYDDFILEPIIKKDIRNVKKIGDKNYYIVYLPSYSVDSILKVLNVFKKENFILFTRDANFVRKFENVTIRPINNTDFVEAMVDCSGIITSGGFETPAEGLYLGKKMLIIPIKGQYEQKCNSLALEIDYDILVEPELDELGVYQLINRIEQERILFPDNTKEIIERIKN